MEKDSILGPGQKRTRGFVLTSLIDVIFLLLVFFMLSSQIAPYSLLTVSDAAPAGEAVTAPRAVTADAPDLVFIVSRGRVRAGTATLPLQRLSSALGAIPEDQRRVATVLTTRSARVQDVVRALEALEGARFEEITLLRSPT